MFTYFNTYPSFEITHWSEFYYHDFLFLSGTSDAEGGARARPKEKMLIHKMIHKMSDLFIDLCPYTDLSAAAKRDRRSLVTYIN